MIAVFLFWISAGALIHTYLLYPLLLSLFARGRSLDVNVFFSVEEMPPVSVLMAVHNEQDVLMEKLKSLIENNLSDSKLEILIGSDASTDNTNAILEKLALSNSCLRYVLFEDRMGKSAVINELVKRSEWDILIITDANVILEKDTIYQLVKHFKNSGVGLVDSRMKHMGLKESGISVQENAYVSMEARIKYLEGILWGTMMGPSGGCYAVRKRLYRSVPAFFLVDDFFINMEVINSRHRAIMEPEAIVYEDVSNSLREEIRRKIRIATGNFQNLKHFSGYRLSAIPGLFFSYFSHKVLRWMGPFFLISIFLSTFYLRHENNLYFYLFVIQLFILILPLIDYLLGKIKIHILILRFITHFLSMNFALLAGFVNFLKGVKTNVWQPTRRNQ
jgi:cellulose synthase/poly-beta-1,6-N-acetylglucosamine synthase-like glycosyltransferase